MSQAINSLMMQLLTASWKHQRIEKSTNVWNNVDDIMNTNDDLNNARQKMRTKESIENESMFLIYSCSSNIIWLLIYF